MKITFIETLEGRTEDQWWEREDFHGRSSSVYKFETVEDAIKGKNLELLAFSPVPDDLVICDLCNERITEFPVPVVTGSYALCGVCLEEIKVKGG